MSYRIALAVIAGDDCIDEGIMRMLASVRGRIDGIFISFNGSNTATMEDLGERVRGLYGDFPGEIASCPWTDDFATARNHSFHIARTNANGPTMIADWILWLDCDDELPETIDLQEIVARAERRHAHHVFLPYTYQSDEHGELYSHLKERLFRADVDFRWVYPIHENCVGPIGTRRLIVPEWEAGGSVLHLRGPETPKRDRNRRIIACWYREEPEDKRALQMMAHEIYSEVDDLVASARQDGDVRLHDSIRILAKEALDLYRRFIDTRAPDDDGYVANTQVGRLYRILDEHQKAINIFLQGIKLRPKWPSAYCEIAETYLLIGYHDLAIRWAEVCMRATALDLETFVPIEPLDLAYRPHMIAGAAYMEKHEFTAAEEHFQLAHDIRPDDFTYGRLIDARDRAGLGLVGPNNDAVAGMRETMWGDKADQDRSICFVVPPQLDPWDAEVLEERGLGGTEASVVRVAQQFALRGWRVVIFGTPPREGRDDHGIEWYSSRRWHPDEPFTATIALRSVDIFEANVNAKVKISWMHDVNVGDVRLGDNGDRFAAVDVMVCPSAWHARHMMRVYAIDTRESCDMHFIVNGFDVDDFYEGRVGTDDEQRVMNRFVYASSPDRGLERLLHMWPKIKERHPAAALEIFYGWDNIDRLIDTSHPMAPSLQYFKTKITRMIDRLDGVTWHGRVNQETLSRYLRTSGVMAYPADFLDTFGIVFHQALVAGCVPIMPNLGALGEMMPRQLVVGGAPPNSEVFEGMFLDRIDEVMSMTDEERVALVNEHYDVVRISRWQEVGDYWVDLIEGYLNNKDNPVKVIKP